jgi:hypothetical protein
MGVCSKEGRTSNSQQSATEFRRPGVERIDERIEFCSLARLKKISRMGKDG